MFLTKEEERMLEGEEGPAIQQAMKLLTKLGEVFGAEKLIEIRSSQISGISFKNIGDAGLEFIEDMLTAGGSIKTLATLNPAGMDLKRWKAMGIPNDFAEKQWRIVQALHRLGAVPLCSCTPYISGNMPLFGEHIAWAESSAVSFANSIIGARTNRESGPTSLAASLTGRTPLFGYHYPENRLGTHLINLKIEPRGVLEHSCLGYLMGETLRNAVPVINGLVSPSVEELKAIGAGGAASGAIAMYHINGITPEAPREDECKKLEKIEIGKNDIRSVVNKLSTAEREDVDIVTIGCPHCNLDEIRYIAESLSGKKIREDKTLWVCTSASVRSLAERTGHVGRIEKAGGLVVADTCMVVAPLEKMGFSGLATNSAKAAHYVPSTCKIPALLGSLDECLSLVT